MCTCSKWACCHGNMNTIKCNHTNVPACLPVILVTHFQNNTAPAVMGSPRFLFIHLFHHCFSEPLSESIAFESPSLIRCQTCNYSTAVCPDCSDKHKSRPDARHPGRYAMLHAFISFTASCPPLHIKSHWSDLRRGKKKRAPPSSLHLLHVSALNRCLILRVVFLSSSELSWILELSKDHPIHGRWREAAVVRRSEISDFFFLFSFFVVAVETQGSREQRRIGAR